MRTFTPPPRVCLDVGVGSGEYDFNPRCRIDSSLILMLDVEKPSKKILNVLKIFTNCEYVVASCEMLPIRDQSIDRVYMCHVLEHVRNDVLALREVYRCLKSGGTCILHVPNIFSRHSWEDESHVHHYTTITLIRTVRKAGFREVHPEPNAGSLIPKPIRLVILFLFYTLSEEIRLRLVKR